MFSQCYNNCEILPSRIFSQKSLKAFENSAKTVSLKQSPKRSLKCLKTQTTLNQKRDDKFLVQSLQFSLPLSPQNQKASQYSPLGSMTQRYFTPNYSNSMGSGSTNIYIYQPIRIMEQKKDAVQTPKVIFNYDKQIQYIINQPPLIQQQSNQNNKNQAVCQQENVKSQMEVKLSQISEEKQDILSVEFGKQEHTHQQMDKHQINPKLAVSLMNSRLQNKSIVLQKPLKFTKLLKLT